MEIVDLLLAIEKEGQDATNWHILKNRLIDGSCPGWQEEDSVLQLQTLLARLESCKGQEEAWARYYTGCRELRRGNVQPALRELLRCREIGGTDAIKFEVCELLGDIFDERRDLSAAADFYSQAADAACAFPRGDRRFISAQFRLCSTLCQLGAVERAEQEHGRLKRLADEMVDDFARAVEKGIQGLIHETCMRYHEAKEASQTAAEILRSLDVPTLDKHLNDEERDDKICPRFIATSVMVHLGALQAIGRFHEFFRIEPGAAKEVYHEALFLAQRHSDDYGENLARCTLANICAVEGDFSEAELHLGRMQEITGPLILGLVMQAKLICTKVQAMLSSEALDFMTKKDEAMVELASARDILAQAEKLLESDSSLKRYWSSTVHYWQGFVEMKAFQHEQAIHYCKKAIHWFNASESNLRGTLDSSGRIAHHETGKMIYRCLQLCCLNIEPKQVKQAVVWAERDRARDMVFQLGDVCSRAQEFDSNEEAAWEEIQAVCRLAGEDTVFLMFTEISDCVTITYFLNAGDEPKFREFHLREIQIFDCVSDLLECIQNAGLCPGLEYYHRLLITPWEEDLERIKPRKLIIIPTQELSVLPFAALSVKGTFLVQRFAVSCAPSLRVFKHCQSQQVLHSSSIDKQSTKLQALVVGNPALTDPEYGELLQAEEEATLVAEVLQKAGYASELLLHVDATVDRVLSSIPSSDWVHIATHGVVDETYPNGAVLLASSSTSYSTISNNRYLTISRSKGFKQVSRAMTNNQEVHEAVFGQELAGTGLKAVAVLLSACQTGLGQISGEGVLGLSRCLHLAGVASTVVSLWEVDDDASMEFFTRVYGRLSEGEQLIFALQAAMQGMIQKVNLDGERTFEVRHWAPFILSGSVTTTLNV